MESPVWTPIGSTFSMLQIVMQVSAPSRITSYSTSFQPSSDSSTSTCWMGLAASPRRISASKSASLRATPPPVPPRVYAGRITAGRPISSRTASASSRECTARLRGVGSPIFSSIALNSCRSSAHWIASRDVPSSRTW